MDKIIVSSFYKYINLDNPEALQIKLSGLCKSIDIKGKILIAKEGINGSVSGTEKQIKDFEKKIKLFKEFSDLTFRETVSDYHPFRKTIVRLRPEIVTSHFKVDPKKSGKHLKPSELKKLYDKGEDFILIDTRNDYESKIGKFKNAMESNTKTFKEFPKFIKKIKNFKDKKIVMYCTGGVRCEKASALLVKEGFKDVNQLQGGIIEYINQYPDSYFEGRCFTFDHRLSVETGENTKDIAICHHCHEPCGFYINCKNMDCDKLIICCKDCKEQWNNTCSKNCRNVVKQRSKSIIN